MLVVTLAALALPGCRDDDPPAIDPCEGACGDRASCDVAVARCFCEPGSFGDPELGCVEHGDMCSEAEARLGHSACRHTVDDPTTWTLLSIGHGKEAAFSRAAKFLVPAVPNARLPTVFGDTNWYRSHHCLMARAFEPRFPGLDYEGYKELVIYGDTREYYGGTINELSEPGPEGQRYVFTVETLALPEELLGHDRIYDVYRQLQDRFGLEGLHYIAGAPIHLDEIDAWDDPLVPVMRLPEQTGGPQYEAYTPGLAFGRVRLFTEAELAQAGGAAPYGWQDIVVLDRPPLTLEGVMAASITEARQDVLTHLNVLSSLRGTPNAMVADALEVLAPYEGTLVRLEALSTYYSIREATVEEAEAHWASARPQAQLSAPPDPEFTELVALDDVPVGSAIERSQAVSRFGAKATGLAVLRSVSDPARVADGFGIPMGHYFAFMEANSWQAPVAGGTQEASYAETIALWLDDEGFRSDATLRAARLKALRDEIEANGVVDPALLDAVRAKGVEVFGDPDIMMRFRSSSNAEDSLSFNGAGLYESKSGCGPDQPSDPESACEAGREAEPIDAAIKRVWASLWSFGAYEEREYYQLDHRQVGMGVQVNLRFKDEQANGVAFTGNPLDLEDPRMTINVQLREVPVVGATPGVVAELDRVRVEGGEVAIDREIGSSLLPEGSWVLDDAQVRELALLLAEIAQAYPVDGTPPPGTEVMLDLEFKITAEGQLLLKQVRPFAARPYVVGEGSCR